MDVREDTRIDIYVHRYRAGAKTSRLELYGPIDPKSLRRKPCGLTVYLRSSLSVRMSVLSLFRCLYACVHVYLHGCMSTYQCTCPRTGRRMTRCCFSRARANTRPSLMCVRGRARARMRLHASACVHACVPAHLRTCVPIRPALPPARLPKRLGRPPPCLTACICCV